MQQTARLADTTSKDSAFRRRFLLCGQLLVPANRNVCCNWSTKQLPKSGPLLRYHSEVPSMDQVTTHNLR